MKKTSKILLSALAIFSMFFTITVNAEEQTPQNTSTTKTVADLTQSEFESIVPSSIDVTKTKTEFANFIISNYENDYASDDNNPVLDEIKTKIISLFNDNGYTLDKTKIDAYDYNFDWNNLKLTIYINEFEKDITINFAKENNFNTTDEEYVKNKVKSLKFTTFKTNDEFLKEFNGRDAVFTMYNIGDEENANKWEPGTYDFNKLVNDSSVTVKTYGNAGGIGGATPWGGMSTILCFYKNDVLYDTKYVIEFGAYGTTLENGTPVNMAILDKENNKAIYEEMEKELNNRGLTNIIGAYELTAYGETENSMNISFTLGNDYNGKEVQILHKKSDSTYEIFKTTVTEGKATITVSEFSPFMIALSETEKTTTTPVNNAPNNAQTSSLDIVLYSILAIGSLLGITYIVVKSRKKVA